MGEANMGICSDKRKQTNVNKQTWKQNMEVANMGISSIQNIRLHLPNIYKHANIWTRNDYHDDYEDDADDDDEGHIS